MPFMLLSLFLDLLIYKNVYKQGKDGISYDKKLSNDISSISGYIPLSTNEQLHG